MRAKDEIEDMHISCQKEEFQGMEMITMNMHFSFKKVILSCVLHNCVVIGVSSVIIIIFSRLILTTAGLWDFLNWVW
jgi:hypothetical protein